MSDVAAAVAGSVLLFVARGVALVQTVVRVQRHARPLTPDERELLENVYRDSIAYDSVRIVEGRCGVFGVNKRPFTLGNTIYVKGIDLAARPGVLVHECCHVWQYQHEGSRYAVLALWAQLTVRPSAYRWADELERGRTSWRDFNKEAQAQLVQDYVEAGGSDARFEHHGTDHTDLAKEAIAYLRGLRPKRYR